MDLQLLSLEEKTQLFETQIYALAASGQITSGSDLEDVRLKLSAVFNVSLTPIEVFDACSNAFSCLNYEEDYDDYVQSIDDYFDGY